jgi:hypothetical protein
MSATDDGDVLEVVDVGVRWRDPVPPSIHDETNEVCEQ